MNPTLDFLKKHWRLAAEIVVVLLCLVIGRYTAPKPTVTIQEKIVTQEKVVEKKVIDEQAVETEVSRRVAEFEKTLKTHTVVVKTEKPDGTKTETATTDTDATTKTKTEDDKTVTQVVTKIEYVDRVVEKIVKEDVMIKVETPKPNWLLGPEVMMAFSGPSSASLVPQPGEIFVGVGVDRRVAGPFFLGGNLDVAFNPFHGGGGTPSGFLVGLHLKAEF